MPRGSKPGERRGGRKRGTPNKLTGELKEMILQAAELAGDDIKAGGGTTAYLRMQATLNPQAFMSLLGRVLPLTVAGDKENPVAHSLTWLPPQ